jgi:hypothetical protein
MGSAGPKSGGLIDIVKKGYAWRADGNVCAVRAWLCRFWSLPRPGAAREGHAYRIGAANRRTPAGFISMKTGLSIEAVFTSRGGAGSSRLRRPKRRQLRHLLVGIANESDQVT